MTGASLPVSFVDLPLALALDTVLLPYDIHNSRENDDIDSGQ